VAIIAVSRQAYFKYSPLASDLVIDFSDLSFLIKDSALIISFQFLFKLILASDLVDHLVSDNFLSDTFSVLVKLF